MVKKSSPMKCFVISPIGEPGSETRQSSDKVLKHIIRPVVEKLSYQVTRSDKISQPGIITSQVVDCLVDCDLVIADLTEHNANVFYELAVRHTIRKPVVLLIQQGQAIPFDVSGSRAIQYDLTDPDNVEESKHELEKQITTVEDNPDKMFSPISVAIDLRALGTSKNPLEKSSGEILSLLQSLSAKVDGLAVQRRPVAWDDVALTRRLMHAADSLRSYVKSIEHGDAGEIDDDLVHKLREHSVRIVIYSRKVFRAYADAYDHQRASRLDDYEGHGDGGN